MPVGTKPMTRGLNKSLPLAYCLSSDDQVATFQMFGISCLIGR